MFENCTAFGVFSDQHCQQNDKRVKLIKISPAFSDKI